MDSSKLIDHLDKMIYGDAEKIKEFYGGILPSWYALRSIYALINIAIKYGADTLTLMPTHTLLSKGNQVILKNLAVTNRQLCLNTLKMLVQRDKVIGHHLSFISQTDEEVVYKLALPNDLDNPSL